MPRRPEAPIRDLEYPGFEVRPLTPHIGAEVRGIDLSQPLHEAQLKEVKRAFHDWRMLPARAPESGQDELSTWA